MVSPVSPVGPAPPPASAAPPATAPAIADDTTALLAGLPAHSPLAGLRQDPGVTDRLTGPGRYTALRTALLHPGAPLDGWRQLPGDRPALPAPEPPT